MKLSFLAAVFTLCACSAASANDWLNRTKTGDTALVEVSYENEAKRSDGGSSSSSGHTRLLERVVSSDGIKAQVEYDLSPEANEDERQQEWLLPVRFLVSADGSKQLLNEDELSGRLDRWLQRANLTREACGNWIFTWNAFKIECDPNAAGEMVEDYGLRFLDYSEGELINHPLARAPGVLQRDGDYLVASMPLDPDAVQRERAASDLVVAQILGKTLDLETALEKRKVETVEGSVTIRLRMDGHGAVQWREVAIQSTTIDEDGVSENAANRQVTQIIRAEDLT